MFSRVGGLFWIGGLLASGLVIALWFNLARFRDSLNWVEHTNGALREISTTEVSLFRAESGERGWILSGDLSYFTTYRRAAHIVTTSLQALEQMVGDNAEQMHRVMELRSLIDARLADFAQAVGLGVGLSLSRTIIEAHHGRILVEPNPGGGTIFRFTLRSGLLKDAGGED